MQTGRRWLTGCLQQLETIGVNHVAMNLRFNPAPVKTALEQSAHHVPPTFN